MPTETIANTGSEMAPENVMVHQNEHQKERLSNPWLVLVLLLFIYILNFLDRYLISGLVDPIKGDLEVGDGFIGLLMGPAFAFFYTALAIPIARFADRHSRTMIICVGCFIWSLFTVLSGYAQTPWHLAIARIGVGVGEAAFVAPAYSILAAYFVASKRGMVFAILNIAVYLGQIGAFALGPAIAAASDWRMAFKLVGLPGMLIAPLAWLLIKEPHRVIAPIQDTIRILPLTRKLFVRPSYVLLAVGMGLGAMSGLGFGLWGPTLFSRAYELPIEQASPIFGVYFGFAGLFGMLMFGAISDRITKLGMQRPSQLAASALLSATICIMLVTWSPTITIAKWLAVPSGLLGGGWSIGVLATLQYILPDRFRATATSLFIMVMTFLSFVIGPLVTGLLSQGFGDDATSLRIALSIVIPVGLLGAAMIWMSSYFTETDKSTLS